MSLEEVLRRLEHLVRPRTYERILIAEPEPAMREILHAEITEHLSIAVDAVDQIDFSRVLAAGTVVIALPDAGQEIDSRIADGRALHSFASALRRRVAGRGNDAESGRRDLNCLAVPGDPVRGEGDVDRSGSRSDIPMRGGCDEGWMEGSDWA